MQTVLGFVDFYPWYVSMHNQTSPLCLLYLEKNTTYPQTFIKSHKGLSYCRLLSNLSLQTVIISQTKSTSFISCFVSRHILYKYILFEEKPNYRTIMASVNMWHVYMYTCILNIGEYPQSDKGRTSIIQQHNMERRKMHILDNLHYKIKFFMFLVQLIWSSVLESTLVHRHSWLLANPN